MTLDAFIEHAASGALMLAAAALLAWRLPERRARIAWVVLLAVAVAYALALNLQPANFPQSNFAHYYLGAKYPAPYADTYRLVLAGQGRPQIGMRDLDHPERIVRSSPYEQRAYYLDLLRAARVPFDPLVPLDALAARALDSGAVEAEAQRILAARLPASRIDDYRRDARAAGAMEQGKGLTLDYGYNGSPLYGLLRRADPTLALPFGRIPALVGFAWQLLGVALVAWLAGVALGLTTVERLAVAGLIAASVEFAEYALPGLVFTELWAPVLLAVVALKRRRAALAGAAIACAGLLKLFPYLLLATLVAPCLRSFVRPTDGDTVTLRRRTLVLLVSCAVSTLALGMVALASGRTWIDFFHKVATEFASGAHMVNSVSIAAALATLGVPDRSPLATLIPVAALVALLAPFWTPPSAEADTARPRRALLLLAGTSWLVKSWLNYYALVPFMLLPLVARRHRAVAVTIAAAMAGSYLLPPFDDRVLLDHPALHVLKLAPYLAAPVWLVALELREMPWGRTAGRIAAAIAIGVALATVAETWRGHEIERLATRGESALASGDTAAALSSTERLLRLSPRDAATQRQRAIALATAGRLDDALPGFARAVSMDPADAAARDDYGRALLMAGRVDEASIQLDAARTLAPDDPQILFELARARAQQGRRPEAVALLVRARELAPEEPAIADALASLGAR